MASSGLYDSPSSCPSASPARAARSVESRPPRVDGGGSANRGAAVLESSDEPRLLVWILSIASRSKDLQNILNVRPGSGNGKQPFSLRLGEAAVGGELRIASRASIWTCRESSTLSRRSTAKNDYRRIPAPSAHVAQAGSKWAHAQATPGPPEVLDGASTPSRARAGTAPGMADRPAMAAKRQCSWVPSPPTTVRQIGAGVGPQYFVAADPLKRDR
jgi:hypothetical protein